MNDQIQIETAEISDKDNPSSLLEATEVTKNIAWTLAGVVFTGFIALSTFYLHNFYEKKLPEWQVSWNNQFFGNIDAIAGTIDKGSNRIGGEIGGIKSEMVDMKSEMVDLKIQVVGSMNHIGQITDYQMRVMNGQFGGMRQDIKPSNMMRDIMPW